MKRLLKSSHFYQVFISLCFLLILIRPSAYGSEPIHHQLKIAFEPLTSMIRVQDKISIETTDVHCDFYNFYLHAAMKVEEKETLSGWIFSIESPVPGNPYLQKLLIRKKPGESCPKKIFIKLRYSGAIVKQAESKVDSKVSKGFVFSGAEYFYPVQVNSKGRVTFKMEVSLPETWESLSQGGREKARLSNGRRIVRWNSKLPSEDIFLIGNQFNVYEEKYRGISLYAFLLQGEANLANKYIETAKYYIDFYSKLLGPYPYSKFALVENSQQTGYGMPSFTLMGSQIIRFPFILHSSFPHEILHNWWGNGVFTDSSSGNWSEGLTTYLADHLLLELKGKGSQYRFQEMLKYLSYVNNTNEFAINEFSHRESMASQAIGYGKLMMTFHMLRNQLGKDLFLQGLKKFYKDFKYRYAGFEEMEKTFEAISGEKLDWFFGQWIERKGAPEFELLDASYEPTEGRYDLFIEVKQKIPAYRLKLPVAIWKEGMNLPEIHHLNFDKPKQKFHLHIAKKPKAIRLDPYSEVFRRLDVKEVPASIGQTFGAAQAAISLPTAETKELSNGYFKFSKFLIEKGNIIQPGSKDNKDRLSSNLSLWVFGKNNEMGQDLLPMLKKNGIDLKGNSFVLKEGIFPLKNHSFIFTLPRRGNEKGSITWLIASSEDSIHGLMRKLPHYGKYGYLVFKGKEPENLVKGSWRSNPASLQKIFSDGNFALPSPSPLVNIRSNRSN